MSKQEKNIRIDNFPERLDAEMKAQDLTQSALAVRVGVSQSRVSGWLKGDSLPQPRTALSLSRALGVSMRWLMTGEGEKADLLVTPPSHKEEWKIRALAAEAKLAEVKVILAEVLKKI